jgi:16S rRNA processing protein RimM
MNTPEPRYLVVGRVLRPHGVRGELRVEIVTGYPERLKRHARFYLAPANATESTTCYEIKSLRIQGEIALIKLEGCNDRNEAELLRNMLVQIPTSDAVPLEKGEYYHFQIVGMQVETEAGESLGHVAEILETGANDVYVVHGPRGEILLPAVESVVLDLDVESKRMVVRLLPGTL